MKATLLQLRKLEHVQFPEDAQATVGQVRGWVQWAIKEYKAEIIMVDHFHRLDVGGGQNYRVAATEAVRQLKNLALETGVVMLMSAQFNRSTDPMDILQVPDVSRFKETGALVEEASVALVLSRQLRRDVTPDELKAVRDKQREALTLAERDVMRVGCVAHRRRDLAQVRPIRLVVTDTFVKDRF
jgi:replicative DNA helicase